MKNETIKQKRQELREWLESLSDDKGLVLFNRDAKPELKEWLKNQGSPRGMMLFNTVERIKNELL